MGKYECEGCEYNGGRPRFHSDHHYDLAICCTWNGGDDAARMDGWSSMVFMDEVRNCEFRKESVKQIVSEMLGCICQLSEDYGGCLGDSVSGIPPCEHAGEWHAPCYETFAERLRVLGVLP